MATLLPRGDCIIPYLNRIMKSMRSSLAFVTKGASAYFYWGGGGGGLSSRVGLGSSVTTSGSLAIPVGDAIWFCTRSFFSFFFFFFFFFFRRDFVSAISLEPSLVETPN